MYKVAANEAVIISAAAEVAKINPRHRKFLSFEVHWKIIIIKTMMYYRSHHLLTRFPQTLRRVCTRTDDDNNNIFYEQFLWV